jgi:hypothetical protein
MAVKYGKDTPLELVKWSMMERFGWTPEQFAGLSLADLFEFLQVEEGRNKARPPAKPLKGRR